MNQPVGQVERGRVYVFALRALGSAGRWWPFLLVGAVAFLGWEELRRIDLNQVRHALHSLSGSWLLVASAFTVLNLALLGCYDLVTLEGSPAPRTARWGLGTLAFAWSNFLTLGPIAGPAIRFWLYRPYGVDGVVLRGAIVANIVAFATTLAVCFLGSWGMNPALAPIVVVAILGLLAVLLGRLGGDPEGPPLDGPGGRGGGALVGGGAPHPVPAGLAVVARPPVPRHAAGLPGNRE